MEALGLAVGVIPELRHYVASIKERFNNCRDGPATFQGLNNNLDRLLQDIEHVEELIQEAPDVLPTEISSVLNENCASARESLNHSNNIMKELSRVFPASGSGFLIKVRSFLRATAYKNNMGTAATQIKNASDKILCLISVLANVHIHRQGLCKPGAVGTVNRAYCRESSTPALPHTIRLNFDQLTTPEGMLKHYVLSNGSSEIITGAVGMINRAFGVVGMAGVGKTIALQGLAGDEGIRNRFPDGIHYFSLGRGATVQTTIEEIVKILRITRATASDIDNVKKFGNSEDCC